MARRASQPALTASGHASRPQMNARAESLDINSDRIRKHSTRRKTVQVTSWVGEPISNQIDRKAREWKTTRSNAAARLIERGLKNDIFSDYEAILSDTIERAVGRAYRKTSERQTSVLYRSYSISVQNLHLLINLLSRIGSKQRLTPEQLDAVISWSREEAAELVARKDELLHQAVADWLRRDQENSQAEEREPEEVSEGGT
jgi:fibrillarin-like rRNA methylase